MGIIEEAKSKMCLPEIGTPVRIADEIASKESCGGFLVKQDYIDSRKSSIDAEYAGFFPGTGGDVWAIKHDDGSIGAYMFTEVLDREK